MKLKPPKLQKWIFIFIGLLSLGYLLTACQIYQYADTYHEDHSDVGIILGAGKTDGKLSNIFMERCNHGMYLFQSQKVEKIIVTGGLGEKQQIADSRAGKNYLIEKGIPTDKILIEEQSNNTFENLLFASELMKAHQLSDALIISDPLHMKRAMKIAEIMDINGLPSPTPSSMYRSAGVKLRFLLSEAFFYGKLFFTQKKTPETTHPDSCLQRIEAVASTQTFREAISIAENCVQTYPDHTPLNLELAHLYVLTYLVDQEETGLQQSIDQFGKTLAIDSSFASNYAAFHLTSDNLLELSAYWSQLGRTHDLAKQEKILIWALIDEFDPQKDPRK